MQYNLLPKTSTNVSQISLGTLTFGGQTNEADSFAIMDYATDKGINLLDTADVYNYGVSEEVVGKWMQGRRSKVLLASKVGQQMGQHPNDTGLSRRHILASVEESLKRLRTDYIDIYYMHAPDHLTDIEETLGTMNDLVRCGKIRYPAVSNYAAWQIADMLHICDKRAYVAPVITQNVHNLITRGVEAELVPFLKEHKIGMTTYQPIAAGLLTGKHKPGTPDENTRFASNKSHHNRYWSQENFGAVEALAGIAAQHGHSLLELAMKWCVGAPGVTSVIVGASKLEQLRANIDATQGAPLDKEAFAACDEVWRQLAGNRFAYYR